MASLIKCIQHRQTARECCTLRIEIHGCHGVRPLRSNLILLSVIAFHKASMEKVSQTLQKISTWHISCNLSISLCVIYSCHRETLFLGYCGSPIDTDFLIHCPILYGSCFIVVFRSSCFIYIYIFRGQHSVWSFPESYSKRGLASCHQSLKGRYYGQHTYSSKVVVRSCDGKSS